MGKSSKSICIVSPFPPPNGGMAIQAQKLVTLLKRSGFDVITVKTNTDFPEPISFMSRIKGARTLCNLSFFLKNLHKCLSQVDVVYFFTGFFNFFFWVTYPALLLIKAHGKKVILSCHGGAAEKFFERYGLLLKPILNTVDIISTPSGFLRDVFLEAFDIEAKIIPNITDLDQFEFRERPSIQPSLLVTRSLEPIYNVECVIRAFKIVHDHFPEAKLGIVGDGSERKKLEDLVSRLGLYDIVVFYGGIEHTTIQSIYNEYDIFINASNVDNLPLTILEAFASGLPVISTRPGGIPYMVEDGVTGLLVDIGDCEALAGKVINLIDNPQLSSRLSGSAREECKKYSWEKVKPLLLPLL